MVVSVNESTLYFMLQKTLTSCGKGIARIRIFRNWGGRFPDRGFANLSLGSFETRIAEVFVRLLIFKVGCGFQDESFVSRFTPGDWRRVHIQTQQAFARFPICKVEVGGFHDRSFVIRFAQVHWIRV